jgi:tRNA(Ile)-lysidine synthase
MRPLGPWPADRQVAVAVSGGADSLCLAFLLRGWSKPNRTPLALVVDHGLRPASGHEAATTVATLTRLGLRSRLLSLSLSGGPGLQARARTARHAVLAEACADAGLPDLLLGHHRDDQEETIAMRARAGSGPNGLAGMSAVSERHRLRIVRPLLSVRSTRLRATLRAAGLPWVEDPSNSDPRFERSRLRASAGGVGVAAGELTREAEAAWLARHVKLHEAGFGVLAPGPVPAAALSRLLQTISGRVHPPRRAEVERLANRPGPATLHGARLVEAGRLGPGLLVCREVAAMSGPVPAVAGTMWDDRFRLVSAVPLGWTLGPFPGSGRTRQSFPAVVEATLPALFDECGRLQAAPQAGIFDEDREIDVIFAPVVPNAPSFFTNARHSEP